MKAKLSTLCGASLALILAAPAFAADRDRAQAGTDTNQTNIRTETATPQTAGSETSMRGGHGAHEPDHAGDQQPSTAQADLEPVETEEFFETASAKGAAEKFEERVSTVRGRPKVLIIRMRNVPAIDSTAMHALSELVGRARNEGTHVLLSDVHSQPMIALGRSSLLDEMGEDAVFGNLEDALERAAELVSDGTPTETKRATA